MRRVFRPRQTCTPRQAKRRERRRERATHHMRPMSADMAQPKSRSDAVAGESRGPPAFIASRRPSLLMTARAVRTPSQIGACRHCGQLLPFLAWIHSRRHLRARPRARATRRRARQLSARDAARARAFAPGHVRLVVDAVAPAPAEPARRPPVQRLQADDAHALLARVVALLAIDRDDRVAGARERPLDSGEEVAPEAAQRQRAARRVLAAVLVLEEQRVHAPVVLHTPPAASLPSLSLSLSLHGAPPVTRPETTRRAVASPPMLRPARMARGSTCAPRAHSRRCRRHCRRRCRIRLIARARSACS